MYGIRLYVIVCLLWPGLACAKDFVLNWNWTAQVHAADAAQNVSPSLRVGLGIGHGR